MEDKKKKTIIKRILASLCLVAFCFALFGSLFSPIRKVNAEQVTDGDVAGIQQSNNFYRMFLPFDIVSSYEINQNETSSCVLDLNYFDFSGSITTTEPPTVPSYSLTALMNGCWDYSIFYNYLFWDNDLSYYSDFGVRCVDSYWMLGGLAYEPFTFVEFRQKNLTFNLSQPILVDHTAGDTTFSITSSNYDSTAFCLKWTADIDYTLIYIDNNGEQQTINYTGLDTTPFSIEVGQNYNIMPALPANADLNYPYLLYMYKLVLTPYSPNGALTELTETYAVPLFRFDSYAYKTVDYRYLEFEFYDTNVTIVEPVDSWVESIRSFFFDSIHGFLSTEILPGVSFYWILFICVGIPILIAILKIWLGG